MKLAIAEDVIARQNLAGIVGTSNYTTVDSALDAATSIIESLLRTRLSAVGSTDYFDYHQGSFDSYKPVNLWLSQKYMEGAPKVYVSADGLPITSLTSATLLASTDVIVDKARGMIKVLSAVIPGYSVLAVKYEAGFSEGSSEIPEWMKEAAISAAVHIVHTQSVAHGKKDQQSMAKELARIVYAVVNEHIVTPFDGLYPANTVIS